MAGEKLTSAAFVTLKPKPDSFKGKTNPGTRATAKQYGNYAPKLQGTKSRRERGWGYRQMGRRILWQDISRPALREFLRCPESSRGILYGLLRWTNSSVDRAGTADGRAGKREEISRNRVGMMIPWGQLSDDTVMWMLLGTRRYMAWVMQDRPAYPQFVEPAKVKVKLGWE